MLLQTANSLKGLNLLTEEQWQSKFWTDTLGDHIEVDHEREMPGYWTFNELEMVHSVLHKMRDDWDHDHEEENQ